MTPQAIQQRLIVANQELEHAERGLIDDGSLCGFDGAGSDDGSDDDGSGGLSVGAARYWRALDALDDSGMSGDDDGLERLVRAGLATAA